MSALGSSVINKSSTKIKPKAAPARRAPASSQTSARTSVDRQAISQTPQPRPTIPDTASSPTPTLSVPQPTPLIAQHTTPPTQAAAQNINATLQNAELSGSEESGGEKRDLPPKRPRDSEAVSIPRPSIRAPPTARNTSVPAPAGPLESAASDSEARKAIPSLPQYANPEGIETEDTEQPAAKRRRVCQPQEENPSAGGTVVGPDEALPTVEAGKDSRGATEASAASPPLSQVYSQSIRRSIEPAQPASKARKPKQSAKAKGKKSAVDTTAPNLAKDVVERFVRRSRVQARAEKRKDSNSDAAVQANENTQVVAATSGANGEGRKGKKRKKREVTPDDAEDVRIVPAEVLMSELTKNLRTGRKSTRGIELQKRERNAKAERKQKRIDRRNGIEAEPSTDEIRTETAEERLERLAPRVNENVHAVPTVVVVNNEIRIDESSLVIDRHAQAAAERDAGQEEAVEEDDLSRRVTQNSWLKRDRSGGWNELLTDQFYDGLRMFGTDFNTISKMFPGRSRHSVKLKFNKEEKDDPRRIEKALKGGRLQVNMDEFQKMTSTVFGDPKELEEEMAEDRRIIEEEQAAAKAAQDEVLKQRADEAAAEAEAAEKEAAENESSAKENQGAQEGEEGTQTSGKETKRKKHGKSKESSVRQRKKADNKALKPKAPNWKKRQVAEAEKALEVASGAN